MADIKLNFINESNDQNNSNVVIFQRNVATNFDEIAVAWKVIKNCGTGWQHPFTFPMNFQVGASDSWGNQIVTPIDAQNGDMYSVLRLGSGDQLAYFGPGGSRKEVQVRNDLMKGSICAEIYKEGRLLATKTGISPGQKAVFEFKPTLWIGVISQVEEGQVINSAIISDVNTELGLLGIASADIVMRGGGTGPNASHFTFSLANVVYC
jgi:hypothetical protein